jgi:hypothetical protein
MIFKAQANAYVREEPLAANFTIEKYDVGEPSYDIPSETIGKRSNGKYNDGPAYSQDRKIQLPDFKTDFLWSGDVTQEPQFFELMKSCGYTIVNNGPNPELIWEGSPDCQALSGDLYYYTCGAQPTALKHKARSIVGNAEIGAEGPNSPILVSFTSMMGAYLGNEDVSSAAIPAITGNDAAPVEQMGKYTVSVGGVTYQVQTWNFNPNNTISTEGGNNPEGVARMKVSGQSARLTMTATALPVATDDPVQDIFDNVVLGSITFTGGTGAHYDITFDFADVVEIQPSDSDGTLSFDLTYSVQKMTAAQKA